MDDLLIGRFGQGGGCLANDKQRQFQIESPIASQILLQVDALDVFLGNEVNAVDACHFVDLHDIAVNQRGCGLCLTTETSARKWGRMPVRS